MRSLYITADVLGSKSGGGRVTLEEYKGLSLLGRVDPIDRARIGNYADPFEFDLKCCELLQSFSPSPEFKDIKLAHFYAGTFTKTIAFLKSQGIKVSYTCAAHDRHLSAKEHELTWGEPFKIPHMQDGPLWEAYVDGYRTADLLITPSEYSRQLMIKYDCIPERAIVIPHGCDPAETPPFPKRFTVGYMGSAGADKGLRYLFEAWKQLNLKDSQLLLAGPYSHIGITMDLIRKFGGGNIRCLGFVPTLKEFYEQISCYVQPSATEGFGIEILEAMAHGRPVIASQNAGGSECLAANDAGRIAPCLTYPIKAMLDHLSKLPREKLAEIGQRNAGIAKFYSWGRIIQQYCTQWINLIGPSFRRGSTPIRVGGVELAIPPRFENLDWDGDSDIIAKHWTPTHGDTCIDVGCGPGVWALVAAKCGAKVVAYDPRGVAHDILLAVASANGLTDKITHRHFGVWAHRGELNFSESSFIWNTNGTSSLVPVVPLDYERDEAIFRDADFINIDAEGAELQVLDGAQELLKRNRPKLCIDIHNNVSLKDLENRLKVLGSYELDFMDKYVIVTPR